MTGVGLVKIPPFAIGIIPRSLANKNPSIPKLSPEPTPVAPRIPDVISSPAPKKSPSRAR